MITVADIKNLPNDTESLKQIIVNLAAEHETLSEKLELLRNQLALLKAKRFGSSSEKLDKQIEQLELQIEEDELVNINVVGVDEGTEISEATSAKIIGSEDNQVVRKKNQPKRNKLPDHLERTDVVLNPGDKCPSCGKEEFRKLGDDVSEVLEYVPSSFKVIRYIRPRCACKNCDQIVQAPQASKTIDKGKAGSGLLSHIIIQKYCNHLPFYRQSQMYGYEGIDLSRSTMASWAGQCSRLLAPLIEEIKVSIFASSHIHGDDTPIKVLAPGIGKTKIGRLWVYARDGRRYGDELPPAVCYFYSPDRKGERPRAHLKDFSGTFHADAYNGYDKLYKKEDSESQEAPTESNKSKITEAACWAHARRKFYEVTVASNKANIATTVLEEISKIYKIEEEIKGLDPGTRKKYRQEKSKDMVKKLFANYKKFYADLPKKSITAKAIAYSLNNQEALMRFLEDGKVEIDNNIVERAIRPVAIGKKNWMFAGSDRGGETSANIYTLIETAKMNGLNPWKYLKQVLATIQDYNSQRIADLLPWNIKLD